MSKTCAKCNDKLKRSEMIVCRLFCGQYFHKDCVGISSEESNILSKSNFNWQCDSCSLINLSNFFNRFTELSQCVSELKREICSLRELFHNPQSVKPLLNSKSPALTDPSKNNLIPPTTAPRENVSPSTSNNSNQSVAVVADSVDQQKETETNNASNFLINCAPNINNNSSFARVNKNNNEKLSRGPISNVPIYGTNTNSDLNVILNNKWVHLSSFSNDTEPDSIVEYISNITKIPNQFFKCFKLTKKDAVMSELPFVNFKLSVPEDKLNTILMPTIWPEFVRVKLFVPTPKNLKQQNAITTT
ncbi:probable serine/threonine-protein kinase tsuA [Episyrphus balteatus]|uniref:probable serine/threonine-protein kinase tsuA n=1 Tax=Episyrphus balteatus TaxID=286459 RepID=UPI002485A685|nr:probable serine/threonine-protein kinase tsuA [Episyrphus balteatus]